MPLPTLPSLNSLVDMPYTEHLKTVVNQHGDDEVGGGGGHFDKVGLHGDVSRHQHGDAVATVTEDGHQGPHYFDWNDMVSFSLLY